MTTTYAFIHLPLSHPDWATKGGDLDASTVRTAFRSDGTGSVDVCSSDPAQWGEYFESSREWAEEHMDFHKPLESLFGNSAFTVSRFYDDTPEGAAEWDAAVKAIGAEVKSYTPTT